MLGRLDQRVDRSVAPPAFVGPQSPVMAPHGVAAQCRSAAGGCSTTPWRPIAKIYLKNSWLIGKFQPINEVGLAN
jgi:hypothetical protein